MSLLKKTGKNNKQAVDYILSAALLCDKKNHLAIEMVKREKDKGIVLSF